MNKRLLGIVAICLCTIQLSKLVAQVYIEYGDGAYPVDICECEVGSTPLNNQYVDPYSMAADPDGNVYYMDLIGIVKIDAVTGNTDLVAVLPPDFLPICMVYGADGLIYTSAVFNGSVNETLIAVNPITGTYTVLGELPAGYFFQGDLFFYQGQLYGLLNDTNGVSVMMQIPLGNPGGATVVHTFPGLIGLVGGISVIYNGVETVFMLGYNEATGESALFQVDMMTGVATVFCPGISGGDLAAPPNFEINCCENFAGNFQSLNLTTVCQNQSITLIHLGDEILTPGSALSFVLMADSTGILPDDILQISANPTFVFDPATMVLNQVYFVAPLAAPGSPGNPNWSAGCIDVGYFASVQWVPTPTVNFSVANPEVCAGDCLTFNVVLTGTPPFSLTYSSNVSGQQSQVFTANTGVLELCPPAGTPPGPAELSAVSLTDANCLCD
jgi:hypothetical protein